MAESKREGYWWCPNCYNEVHVSEITLTGHGDCTCKLEFVAATSTGAFDQMRYERDRLKAHVAGIEKAMALEQEREVAQILELKVRVGELEEALSAENIKTHLSTYRSPYLSTDPEGVHDGLPLVDALTYAGEPTIETGQQEIQALAEHLYDTLRD